MNGKTDLLAVRRKALSARIARQRLDLAMEAGILEPPFAALDKGIAFAGFLRKHPIVPAAAAAAFAILRPRRAFRWLRRGWLFWRFFRNAGKRFA